MFRSVTELQEAIHEFIRINNADPKPFTWTASAEAIIEKRLPEDLKLLRHYTRSIRKHAKFWYPVAEIVELDDRGYSKGVR